MAALFTTIPYLIGSLEELRVNYGAPYSTLIGSVLLSVAIFCAIYLGFFAIKAVGVCIMAKKRGLKYWWLGMIPFANFAVIGKLAGPVRAFSINIKNIGLIVGIIYFLRTVASVVFSILVYGEYFVALLKGALPAGQVFEIELGYILGVASSIYQYTDYFVSLFYLLIYAMLVYAFFSKYAPDKRWVFAVLSVLIEPLFGIFILVVRKNRAYSSVNEYYNEKYARRFGQTYNPYSDPYKTRENPFDDGNGDNKNNNDGDNSSPFDGF